MNVEDLIDMWEEDSSIGDDIGCELKDIPRLHNKYYRNLVKMKKKLSGINEKYNEQKFIKELYYSGRAPDEAYKAKRLDYTLTKTEIPMWIAADTDLKSLRREKESIELFHETLVEIVKQINERKWIMKSIIDYRTIELGIRG